MSVSDLDAKLMRRALRLAERGRGSTRPNPVVGAVVARGARVLADGYHHRAGEDHAEVDALRKLGLRAPRATLYVTLEPCCHTGRTGPCTEVILRAGIDRVVVACRDPNPLVDGRGIARLRRAGVQVDVGVLEDEARAQNRGFAVWIRERRPRVTLKAAATLDGFIAERVAPAPGTIRWITGPRAREHAHVLRAAHDAVVVGSGTVLADDPLLTVRGVRHREQPLRIVLDARLRTPVAARLLSARVPGPPPLVIGVEPRVGAAAALARARALAHAGAEVLLVRPGRDGRAPLATVLRLLAERNVQALLVEGGAAVHGAFVRAGLVDAAAVFLAPLLLGGGTPVAAGGDLALTSALRLGTPRVTALDGDILVEADVVRHPSRGSRL